MKRTIAFPIFALLAALPLCVPVARAGTLTLDIISPQIVAPGGSVDFTATATAPLSNTGPVFLNSDSANVDSPLLLDDSPFFNNFPFFLDPGDSFTGVIVTVTVPSGTPSGTYFGSFEVLGGDTSGDFNPITPNVSFDVTVTPEPATWLFLLAGLLVLPLARRPKFQWR
jgi:hypothetical protein